MSERSREISFGRSALIVAVLMGLGVLATLAREILLAHLFGTGRELEHFRLAFAIPNLLVTSLATFIVAALAPVLSVYSSSTTDQANALRESVVATAVLGLGIGTLGLLTVPLQIELMAPGYSTTARTELKPVFYALWLFFFITACSLGPRAFLNYRGVVWPTASSNLILGGGMAGGVVLLSWLPTNDQTAGNLALVAGISALALLSVHLAALPRNVLTNLRLGSGRWLDRAHLSSSGTVIIVLVGHLLSATPRLVDRAAATELGTGTVAAMDFSFSVITVPGIAFGTVFMVTALPRYVAALKGRDTQKMRSLGIRAACSTLLALLFGIYLAYDAERIVTILFARGAFGTNAITTTSNLLSWHALALAPMVASLILSQACLSMGLTGAFMIVSACRILSKLLAVWYLVPLYDLDGLAASFLVPEIVSFVILCAILTIRLRSWGRT